jgi:hypothetical protein
VSDPGSKRRSTSAEGRLPVPKHAVAIGIIVGGVLGVALGSCTLSLLRRSQEDAVPASDLEPVRAVAPRVTPTSPKPPGS